jgi:hypothetical protein
VTDKPDVAALVEWLQTWSPVTENGKRAHLAASELTRLANENADLKEFDRTKPDAEWREMYEDISKSAGYQRGRADRAEAELSEAKATIERLRAVLEPFAESAAYFDVFGIYGGVPVRHLRDARAALKPNTGEKP